MLGGYELLDEIARGGMGIVFRARQLRLDREVAVKVLRGGEFAGVEAQRRFRAEAVAVAKLQHPGIVSIHDVGEEDGVLWFSMDLVSGKNLAEHTREHPFPARMAAECVQSIAAAVQHAHEQGVLHRDLKPSNILLDADLAPRVTDFGLARRTATASTGGDAELTRTGQILGSPGYSAPEQALGGSADVRTDVYGLGAVLYHLLTGRPPFQGPTLDSIVLQLRENEPLGPRRLNPAVPRDLETICMKCLQKSPARRYASAREAGEDLARFLAGRPILARPPNALGYAWRWSLRHPGIAALLALVIFLMAALVAGSLSFARHQTLLEKRSELLVEAGRQRASGVAESRTLALKALHAAWVIRPSAELRNEAIACLSLPEIALDGRIPPTMPEALPPETGGSADGRFSLRFENQALIVIEKAGNREHARIGGFDERPQAQLDDTGRRIAIAPQVPVKSASKVELREVPSGRILHVLAHAQPVRCLDWAGEVLAVGGEDRLIHVWDTASGTRLHRFSGHDAGIETVRFHPRGQELVSLAQDSVLRVWHAACGVEVLRLERLTEHIGPAWWDAGGTRLFCRRKDGEGTDVFLFEQSRVAQILSPGQDEPRSENLRSITMNAAGTLASSVDENACRVWSLRGGRLAAAFPKTGNEWMTAQLAGDGSGLWLSGWNKALRRVPIHRANEDWPEFGLSEHSGSGSGPLLVATRADGGALALTHNETDTKDDYVEVYFPSDRTRVHLAQHDPYCAALSPDGRWAVTGSFQKVGAMLWSLPDGKLQRALPHTGVVLGTAFTEEGRVLWLWGDSGVQRVNTSDWKPAAPPDRRLLAAFAVSADGRHAASTSRNDIVLHGASGLDERARLTVPAFAGGVGFATLAFSGNGNRLSVHAASGTVVVYDLNELRVALRREGMDW